MTYSRTQRPADRVATIVAVGALQAAACYAVIAGLSVAFTPSANPPPISATNSPLPPPPESASPRRPHRTERETVTTATPLPTPLPTVMPTVMPTAVATTATGPTGGTEGTTPAVIPAARPTVALATPLGPRPLGRTGDWVTEADYPTNAIRLGHAGLVGFVLAVAPTGRVTGCEITRSSGFAELDALTCSLLLRRARFRPATDEQGAATSGRFASAVRWQIPD